jgi:hypothetical protein
MATHPFLGLTQTMREVFSSQSITSQIGRILEGLEETSSTKKTSSYSTKESRQNKNWRWPGLPERLFRLAENLEGKDLVKAREIDIDIGEPPSRVWKDYRNTKKWGPWIERYITRPQNGFWKLNDTLD